MTNDCAESPAASMLAIQQKIEDALQERAHVINSTTTITSPILRELYQARSQILNDVPSFWMTTMLSHPAFTFLINASDTQVLRYLTDLDVLPRPKSSHATDFDIVLTFKPNPFFSETRLVKQYIHSDHHGRVVTVAPVSWTFHDDPSVCSGSIVEASQLMSGFFKWITTDIADNANLGELIRDQIFPYAIDLYFGTYNHTVHNTDQSELQNTVC